MGELYLPTIYILSKGENAMSTWATIEAVWDEMLAFFDRAFQWLKYLFTDEKEWAPEDWPTLDN